MTTPAHMAIAPAEFADRMQILGPFEMSPNIAVACSGGPDSMALAALADRWARSRGGVATALVVDHGLRPESADEAGKVCSWLTDAGIEAVQLTWQGSRPISDKQAAARHIRYLLMCRWCRDAGSLHLLLGHHRQDQAETVLLRLARGSGVDGLAAMPALRETEHVRLLRPLLEFSRERVRACVASEGIPYVRDPSNDDAAFARVRMRRLVPALAVEGLTEERLTGTTRRMARAREALESAATELLAGAAALYPEGYALVDRDRFRMAPEEVALRALSRLLACIGGNRYGPRLERLERLHLWLTDLQSASAGRTLGGCRIVRRGSQILICRETDAAEDPVDARNGVVWDRRFRLAAAAGLPKHSRVGKLGRAGWRQLTDNRPELRRSALPAAVRQTLPAVWALDEVIAVPHLSYRQDSGGSIAPGAGDIAFLPMRPLSGAVFHP